MKKSQSLIFVVAVTVVLLSACGKTKIVSCSPSLDKWAKENVTYYSTSSRNEFVALPMEKQRAIYGELSNSKKCELWYEKFNILRESGDVSSLEYEDLESLVKAMAAFSNGKDYSRFNEFADAWLQSMLEKYSWSRDRVFYLVFTWLTESEFNNVLEYSPYTKGDKIDKDAGYDTKCDCTSSLFGCPASMSCEKNIKCVDKETCGIMGTSSCVGVCL